ncbi:hypothetical protein MKZ38_004491 [Zalerion maritima]|uniref:Fibronectin type-III domain-containing protein n=1 Tax=Zalerion maritima TaxID=339359 RepID=A0AAD5RMD9_9PEZI|nr:hypothetical protein MKZ38_004491 [Zalerion maritima]
MKFLLCLAVVWSVAAAISTDNLIGRATRVTDPETLEWMEAQHADAMEKYRNGNKVYIDSAAELDNVEPAGPLEKRIFIVAGLAGFALIEATGTGIGILVDLARNLLDIFTKDQYTVWHSLSNCRTYFQTHGGGEEKVRTYDRGSHDVVTDFDEDVGWIDPENNDPPVLMFHDDAIGYFSVQFTATDEYVYDGVDNPKKCPIQGLCNPQLVFYRKQYNMVLDSWLSQGSTSECEYSHGSSCGGLCLSAVKDQFTTGGVVWGGDCAIPCLGDAPDDLSTIVTGSQKFMVVGDSISHGMQSDWTWRWRIYYWLSVEHDIEFVGPYKGTHGILPPVAVAPTPPLFDGETAQSGPEVGVGDYDPGVPDGFAIEGHASWWGRQAAQSKETIYDWVSEYQPDYLLILLGFNDLGWFVSGPEGLLGSMGDLVAQAREAKPDVKLLIGNVVHRDFIGGRQDLVDNTNTYNDLLRDTITNWFRWESPLTYVDVNANYDCHPEGCPDGYDGLHPNTMGEYHIAEAFAKSLKDEWGFFGEDFAVPANPEKRIVNTPENVVCAPVNEGLYIAWAEDMAARGYETRSRLEGMADWWSEGSVYPNTFASFTAWVLDGQTWEFQVRTKGDNDDRSAWSASAFCTAHPKTAPGPDDITTAPSGDGIQLNWSPVTGYDVNRYAVIVWDQNTDGSFIQMYAASCCGFWVGGLEPGHRYGVWVTTYVNLVSGITAQPAIAGGLPKGAREVIIGGGVPGPPTGVGVVNQDATTVVISWTGATGAAAGYAIYWRSIREGAETELSLGGTTTDTSYGVGFLFPGTWYHEFCVAAYNGNLESASVCVTPPVYPGYERKKRNMIAARNYTVPIANGSATGGGGASSMADDTRLRDLFQAIYHNETAVSMWE